VIMYVTERKGVGKMSTVTGKEQWRLSSRQCESPISTEERMAALIRAGRLALTYANESASTLESILGSTQHTGNAPLHDDQRNDATVAIASAGN
jgi:hypothetical protein